MNKDLSKLLDTINALENPEVMSPKEIKERVNEYVPILEQFLVSNDSITFHKEEAHSEVEKKFQLPIPYKSTDWNQIKNFLTNEVITRFTSVGNKHFMAYVPGNPSPPAILGAMMTPFFNQFMGNAIASPGGVALESLTIKWTIKLMGFDSQAWGCYTSGGSMANFTCIYAGLVNKIPTLKEYGLGFGKRPIIYLSDQTHNSVEKTLVTLGIGRKNIRVIPSKDDYTFDTEELQKTIEKDSKVENLLPVMVIASAGTTNTGAIDDFITIKKITDKYNLWFHIDGSYGAFARISKTDASQMLESINIADSLSLDFHKWFFVPFEAGLAITNKRSHLKEAFSLDAEYLVDSQSTVENQLLVNFREYGFPLSREFRGLKVWMTFMHYGVEGVSSFITKDILLSNYLTLLLENHSDFEVLSTSDLSIVCFRYKASDEVNDKIIALLQERGNYYVSRTTIKGRLAIRTCIVNLTVTKETIDGLVKELEEILKDLKIVPN